ncbi:hypothetical protein BD780_001944 [Clostridium tetanomorphum]|uniref:Uncharacterized protein n=1 Tax=Clostridium tetanomorphum TaxID=1553 RepID=A0A923EER5_CLOTT|nr:hypothetical protein [Clostridium tetanomorphum]KAJ49839.1 hypothetical protein CTM_21246 [Clostridium tetanomorphum DSM 665]MBC2399738.1 hypothetical protein [Clostridium tetanomorphum]MBP1865142.1 hypothetical protein [Clostridium tetanomorphum]NRS84719.1 hypothetical protein [Clostridium tetanomorphum]NRZ97935.1 hypothetical protein [Clostridium tetanomorphum]
MKLEIKTLNGNEIHKINLEQFKKFEEWYNDTNSRNIFTYWKDGYTWHIIKPQIKDVKYIK